MLATSLHSSWPHLLSNLAAGMTLGAAAERRLGRLWLGVLLAVCSVLPAGLELVAWLLFAARAKKGGRD